MPARSHINHDEAHAAEDSYFISLSDLMVGLLFIFIIILMAFSISYRSAEDQLTNTDELRKTLLKDVQTSLEKQGVKVKIDEENGILHLPESILFRSGSAKLNENGKSNINLLSSTLYKLLPCYSFSSPTFKKELCKHGDKARGRLDTIFVEGHTDDIPVGKNSIHKDNWHLSMERAIYIYQTINIFQPEIKDVKNKSNQSILSISAYEAKRPKVEFKELLENQLTDARTQNRRIDLRFLMIAPKNVEVKDTKNFKPKVQELMNVSH